MASNQIEAPAAGAGQVAAPEAVTSQAEAPPAGAPQAHQAGTLQVEEAHEPLV